MSENLLESSESHSGVSHPVQSLSSLTQPESDAGRMVVDFTVLVHVEPQGSKNAFVIPGTNRAVIVDQGAKKLKPYRQEVARTAMTHVALRPWAGKHVPVRLRLDFYILKPASCGKRVYPAVKPDIDKNCRSTIDALTGILFQDDAQVVQLVATKNYGSVEKVRIRAEVL